MTRILVNMARRPPFTLVYADAVVDHVRAIDVKYHSLIRAGIEEQLRCEPDTETRSRKPLRRPAAIAARWEIRFGPENRFRVLYDVDRERGVVEILAIGRKEGNRLFIGREEVKL